LKELQHEKAPKEESDHMQWRRRGEGRGEEGEEHKTRRLLRKKATTCSGGDEGRKMRGKRRARERKRLRKKVNESFPEGAMTWKA